MNKQKKKLLLGLGAIAIPIIPIATSISMSTNTTQTRAVDANFMKIFADKVNDSNQSTLDKDLMNRFIATDTYKNEHNWNSLDYNQLHAAMVNIYQMPNENNNGFTMDEKINIAKYVVQENMYRNIFETIGIPKTKTTTQQLIDQASGKVQNPFESTATKPQNFLIANRDIDLKGNTGHISSFEGLHPNEYMVNFSNQTILEYFLGTIAMSTDVANLVSSLSIWRNNMQTGGMTFADALNAYKGAVDILLSRYSNAETTAEELISSSILNIFDIPQTQLNHVNLTNEELFRAVISGGIGEHLHPLDSQATIDDYITETDPDEKLVKESEIFSRIRTILRGFKTHDTIPAMENLVDFSKPINDYLVQAPLTDKNTNRTAIEKFSALLVKYSNDFHNDVEMRVSGNFVEGHALWIRSGHDNSTSWTKVDPTELITFKNKINETPLDQGRTWGSLSQIGVANSAITNRNFLSYPVKSDLKDWLDTNEHHVMASDDQKWYYTGLQVSVDNGANWTDFTPRVHVYEADDSNDSSVKFGKWTAGAIKELTLSDSQIESLKNGNNLIKVRLTFYDNFTQTTPVETLNFNQYASFLSSYFQQKANEAKELIANANKGIMPSNVNISYDATANHSFEVTLNTLNSAELYFSTGNDTHSIFNDETYSYDFRIHNTEVGGVIKFHESTSIKQ